MQVKVFIIFTFVMFCFGSFAYSAQDKGLDIELYHPTVQKIINDFIEKNKDSNSNFIDSTTVFQASGKDFFAIYLSTGTNNQDLELAYGADSTMVAICDLQTDGAVSDCRKVDLGALTGLPSFAVKNDFISFEFNQYYLTFKYTKNDFYLHQFSYAEEGRELYQNGEMQTMVYYRVDPKTGYTIKMRDVGFQDLYPVRYADAEFFIKKYPAIRDVVNFMAGHLQGDWISVESMPFKMEGKDFLAATVSSRYSDEQLSSTTNSWCVLAGQYIMICDNSAGSLSNCRKNFISSGDGCGAKIVYKNNFITFEDSSQDRRGNVVELYYTFKYTKGDFYLHKFSKLSGSADDEKLGTMTEYYMADPKKGYDLHFNDVDFYELEDKYNKNENR